MANNTDLDPFISAAEKKQDLPPGLLRQIIGEAGTGISPAARKTILDTYGIDAKLNNANAVEAAGILLSDALANNKGDAGLALAEYRSGSDRSNWGTDTAQFVRRVRSGRGVNMAQIETPQRTSTSPAPAFDMQMGEPTITGSGVDVAKLAQSTGEQQTFERAPIAMAAAAPSAPAMPEGMAPPIPAAAGEPEGPVQMGPKSLAAYTDGTMPAEKRAAVRRLVQSGAIIVPDGFSLEEPGMMTRAGAAVKGTIKGIGEAVTGSQRRTPETDAAPDWSQMPEWDDLGTLKKLAAMAGSPKEALQIMSANVPGVTVRRDTKGNLFPFSPKAGKEFAVKPGFDFGDVVRAGAVLPIYAAGAASGVGIPAMMGREALVQGGIEIAQTASGGEFNPTDIAAAGLTAGIVPGAAALKGKASAVANRVLDAIPGSTTRQAAEAAAAPVVADVVAPVVAKTVDDRSMGVLLRQASKGDIKAKESLAAMTDVNAADLAAFRELGIEPAADIVSDNPQMRALAGLTRSKVGSEAEGKFTVAVQDSLAKADDVMASFDAQMVEGAPAPGLSSSKVLDSLKANQKALEAQEKELFGLVNKVVPKTTGVQLNGTRSLLRDIRKEVGEDRLTAAERSLMNLADDPNATYGALMRVKGEIGEAMRSRESPFAGVDKGALKRMYGALVQDQVDNVERIGGEELRKTLRQANVVTGTQKRLEERMVAAFGKDLEGSIGPLMTRAIKEAGAGSGGSVAFKKLMAVVPDNLKKEVVGTALAANFRKSVGGGGSVFDLAGFASKYEALRANPEVYSEIVKQLGPGSDKTLRSLYTVSKRMTEARGLKLPTGKANQMLEGFEAPSNLVESILSSAVGRGAVVGAVAAKTGGIGGGMASMMVDALNSGGTKAMGAASDLLTSPEFRELAIASTKGADVSPAAVRKVVMSQWWRDFVKAANMPRDPKSGEQFLTAALQEARQTRGEQ